MAQENYYWWLVIIAITTIIMNVLGSLGRLIKYYFDYKKDLINKKNELYLESSIKNLNDFKEAIYKMNSCMAILVNEEVDMVGLNKASIDLLTHNTLFMVDLAFTGNTKLIDYCVILRDLYSEKIEYGSDGEKTINLDENYMCKIVVLNAYILKQLKEESVNSQFDILKLIKILSNRLFFDTHTEKIKEYIKKYK